MSTRLFRRSMLAALCSLLLTGCVDNQENARQFCDSHRGLIDEERDGETLDADVARDIESDLDETMRDAEDATRSVRGAGRDLVASYGELAGLLDDDEVDEEKLAEVRGELQQARVDLREACADVDA